MHFLVVMGIAGLASAQVYKWVDEHGVTHYAEQPPQGAKAAQVPNSTASIPAPGSAPPADDYKQKDMEFRQRRIQAEAAEESRRQDTSKRREQCNYEREMLAQLRQARRPYTLNESGERIYMDDVERGAAIAQHQQRAAQLCQG